MNNYSEYLKRMSDSSYFSTKQNIPSIIRSHGCKTVLDVGCADGSFTKRIADESGVEVTGLDINKKSISLARKQFPNIDFICGELSHLGNDKMFDCIVFCSVMHEISSYCPITGFRYTKKPIDHAIMLATAHLNPGGIIIVRDGLASNHNEFPNLKCVVFTSKENAALFKKFVGGAFPGMAMNLTTNYRFKNWWEFKNNKFLISEDLLLEFLLTATWGKASWRREVKERKLICTKDEWFEMFKKNNLNVVSYLQTNEEYPEYFEKIIKVSEWIVPETMCVIVAKKENQDDAR